MSPVDVAEILFRVRCVRESAAARRKGHVDAGSLKDVESLLVDHLRNTGSDPGSSAADADELKLRLIHSDPVVPARQDEIASCLDEVARLDGCEGLSHRVVGRWAEFVNRAVFGGNPALIHDDALLPVRPWVKKRKIDTDDLTVMARAFVEWTREVGEAFVSASRKRP